jgi:hypothetical protein
MRRRGLSRVTRTPGAHRTFAWLVFVSLAPVTGLRAHSPHGQGGSGVVGLDVYAQGPLVDVLLARKGADGVRLEHQRSRDGGRTWGPARTIAPAQVATPRRGNDPQIAAAGDKLVALWSVPGTSRFGGGPLATALSTDGGSTWQPGPNPADDGSTADHGFADLLADSASRLHLVWLDSRDGAQGLRASVSGDFGRSWQPNRTIDDRTCECCPNRLLAIGPSSMAVLYRDKDPRDMAVAITDDGGRSWSRRGVAGAFAWAFEGCPEVPGALAPAAGGARMHALVWTGAEAHAGLHVLDGAADGRSFGAPRRLGGVAARHGDLAADGERVLAVWDILEAGRAAVMQSASNDGGRTWDAPRPLSADSVRADHPLVVPTGGGAFLVVWTEKTGTEPAGWNSAVR